MRGPAAGGLAVRVNTWDFYYGSHFGVEPKAVALVACGGRRGGALLGDGG